MLFLENQVFGNRGIVLKGQAIGSTFYVGANASSTPVKDAEGKVVGIGTQNIIKTDARTAGGLDFGSDNGSYRHQLFVDVKCTDKITDANLSSITFTLMDSDDNVTFADRTSVTVDKAQINDTLKRGAVRFNVVSTNKRYIVLKVKLTGTGTAELTSGAILALLSTPTW